MKSFFDCLSRPFRQHLSLFLFIFVLTTLLDVYQYTTQSTLKFTVLVASHNFMNSYLLTLLYTLFPRKLKRIYLVLITIVVSVFSIIDIFSVIKFHHPFDKDVATVIRGTNLNESLEFLASYLSWNLVVVILLFSVFGYWLYRTSKRPSVVGNKITLTAIFVLFSSVAMNCYAPHIWAYGFFGKIQELTDVEKTPDLKEYYTHPRIEVVGNQPQKVVMIIGESFAREHSSLYGYGKKTNPKLAKLVADSSLLVFKSVNSTATHTVPAFKSFMSTYRSEYGDSLKWYEFTTLPEVVRLASYRSSWISNQSPVGFYDNVVAAYARLCDSVNFVGDHYAGLAKTNLDGELVAPLRDHPKDGKRFFFVHLMGSHPQFESRYPSNYSHFRAADYMEFPEHQRENRAAYDNTILYNDAVVYDLIQEFKTEEAVVVYFSDHGLDVYESDPNYCSHANRSDAFSREVSKRIPFMVYLSPRYQKSFPEVTERLRSHLETPYVTENLIYTMMDLMGVRFVENDEVQKYSLLTK